MPRWFLTIGLIGCAGCAGSPYWLPQASSPASALNDSIVVSDRPSDVITASGARDEKSIIETAWEPASHLQLAESHGSEDGAPTTEQSMLVFQDETSTPKRTGLIKSEPMAHATGVKATNVPVPTPEASAYGSQDKVPTPEANAYGSQNKVTTPEASAFGSQNNAFSSGHPRTVPGAAVRESPPLPLPDEDVVREPNEFAGPPGSVLQDLSPVGAASNEEFNEAIDLNLPSALAMVGGQHPIVGFAQCRVQEAYAQLARAEVMWLPTIQSGFSFHRHDGNTQTTAGQIVDLNRNSFQYGLGTGANAAGTTPNPGLMAQFHLADAIFQPKVAERTAWARGHAAHAAMNEQLLNVAIAYTELVDAYQDLRILEESRSRTAELSKITGDFASAGQGLKADADRLQTELSLVENRLIGARERVAVASARLAQALSLETSRQILPLDAIAVPLDMVSTDGDKSTLISTGLASRPELKESQALVAAACEAYRRERYAPFVPSMLLGFSTGGFGGGLGNDLSNVDDRYDFDAVMTWQVRNFGLGERAVRRESSARIQQAQYEKIRVMDQVAREVSEAYSQVVFRRDQISVMQRAIQFAQDSHDLNLARIRDGQGLPLEVLQSVQALETTRRAYLRAVIDHNQAQFRLQWALGWPDANVLSSHSSHSNSP